MKKFATFLSLLAVFFTSVHYSAGIVMKNYYRTTARHMATLDYNKTLTEKKNIDYLIIGDSVPLHAFQAQLISKNSYSICLSGASVFDTWMALQKIDLSKVKKGIIFFNSFNASLHHNDDFWKRFILTGTYSFEELKNYYTASAVEPKRFPATEYSYPVFMLKVYLTKLRLNHYPLELLGRYLNSGYWTFNYYHQNLAWLKERNGSLPIEIPGDTFKLSEAEFNRPRENFYSKPFQADDTDLFYFKRLMSQLEAHGLKVYIPLVPTAEGPLPQAMAGFIKRETGDYRGTQVFALATSLGRSDFFDFNHLNSTGSAKVTEALNNWLNSH